MRIALVHKWLINVELALAFIVFSLVAVGAWACVLWDMVAIYQACNGVTDVNPVYPLDTNLGGR